MGELASGEGVRTLTVSDTVVPYLYDSDVRQRYPDVDLIIGCGDLPFYYLDFLISAFDVPLVYVQGNHDAGPQHLSDGSVIVGVQGGLDLHGRVARVNGLLMAGLEGSIRYRPGAPLMYTETEMWWEVAQLAPKLVLAGARFQRRLDILVCHSPPFGIHDEQDRAHRGFKVFRVLMRWLRPRFLLHGHVHKVGVHVPHRTDYMETTVINVFPYRLLNFPVVAP